MASDPSLGREEHVRVVGYREPADIGPIVVRGVRENRKYIVTHPEGRRDVADRCAHLLRAYDQLALESAAPATGDSIL